MAETFPPRGQRPELIAVIGMSGRFPGAPDVERYWMNLQAGVESISRPSEEDLVGRGVTPGMLSDPRFVAAEAVLDDISLFDASFFGIAPREAELMDPQHRICLEETWKAFDSAGLDPRVISGAVGVFLSAGLSNYLVNNLLPNRALLESVGGLSVLLHNDKDYLATTVSHRLGLTGPSLAVGTACSSSLVAVHLACQSLLGFESDLAVAGGVSLQVPQGRGHLYTAGGIYSSDGHCRAFDEAADGTVGGSGAAVILLKRWSDAVRDGDHVHAVLLGSAVNNDGAARAGFSAPGVDGQAAVISEAHGVAGVRAEQIGYVEAHGTGTPLGDAIELAALAKAFGGPSAGTRPCLLGSVKTNIGHLDVASGIAGLIKTVLAVEKDTIPPSLHFTRPNPELGVSSGVFRVAARRTSWEGGEPRIAGVSSFGMGGTNAHVVLRSATAGDDGESTDPAAPAMVLPLVMSAQHRTALATAGRDLAQHLRAHPGLPLSGVARTLAGREQMACRAVVFTTDRAGTLTALDDLSTPAQDVTHPLGELAREWIAGADVRWETVLISLCPAARRIRLPARPLRPRRFWVEPPPAGGTLVGNASLAAEVPDQTGAGTDVRARAGKPEEWLWLPGWRRTGPARRPGTTLIRCLVLAGGALGDAVAQKLQALGADVLLVRPPEDVAQTPAFLADLVAGLAGAANGPPTHLVHMWSADDWGYARLEPGDIGVCTARGLHSLLAIVKADGALPEPSLRRILAVTRAAHDVLGGDLRHPEQAMLDAGVKVIPREYPQIQASVLDLPDGPAGEAAGPLADAVVAELLTPPDGAVVAIRGQHRWVPQVTPYVPALVSEHGRGVPRPGGVYVITGGLGGVGLALGEFLARLPATVVLSARTEFPARHRWAGIAEESPASGDAPVAEVVRRLLAAESGGGEFVVLRGDVTVEDDMREVLAAARQFGPITGVVHAAGTADSAGMIQRRSRRDTDEVLSAKVAGTLVLDRLLDDTDLDFFVLCSSLGTVLHKLKFGEVGYLAANEFLDAFAAYRVANGRPWTMSIAWTDWIEAGMSARAKAGLSRFTAPTGPGAPNGPHGPGADLLRGMSDAEGVAVFDAILSAGPMAHVLVSTQDLNEVLREHDAFGTQAHREMLAYLRVPVSRPPDRPAEQAPARPGAQDGSTIAARLTQTWQYLLGVPDIGPDDDFFALGGDSLVALRFLQIVEQELGAELSLARFFDHPTLRAVAADVTASAGGPREEVVIEP